MVVVLFFLPLRAKQILTGPETRTEGTLRPATPQSQDGFGRHNGPALGRPESYRILIFGRRRAVMSLIVNFTIAPNAGQPLQKQRGSALLPKHKPEQCSCKQTHPVFHRSESGA